MKSTSVAVKVDEDQSPLPHVLDIKTGTKFLVDTGAEAVADLGGGCIPPHQPKSNDFGRKISLCFEYFGSISGRIPPTDLNVTNPAKNQSQFW